MLGRVTNQYLQIHSRERPNESMTAEMDELSELSLAGDMESGIRGLHQPVTFAKEFFLPAVFIRTYILEYWNQASARRFKSRSLLGRTLQLVFVPTVFSVSSAMLLSSNSTHIHQVPFPLLSRVSHSLILHRPPRHS